MTASNHSLLLAPACAMDYREQARRRLPRQLFDYIDGGSYDESTLATNVSDLRQLRLRQRVLCDVSTVDLRCHVLGQAMEMPVILAPVGLAGMFARRAETQAARAAEKHGVPFCASTVSICSIEEISSTARAQLWFQLYVMRDRDYAAELMTRAHRAGCSVLVLTVDLPMVGARYRDTRNGLTSHLSLGARARRGWDILAHPTWIWDVALRGRPLTFGNLENVVPGARTPADFRRWVDGQFDPSVTWEDLDWVRTHWPGKLVLKGILDVEDAQRAAEAGVDGIVVSNHGGRQLDGVSSTARILPAIAAAVGDRIDTLVDGGVRSGLDVVKMLSLGAKACLVGRAWAYAVAAGGEQAVSHVLRIFRNEMNVAMALTGSQCLGELSSEKLDQ